MISLNIEKRKHKNVKKKQKVDAFVKKLKSVSVPTYEQDKAA